MKKIMSILAALLVFSFCFCSAYADVIPPSITVLPAGSGTTSQVGQPNDAPPQITYQASPNTGYVFEGWYENGSCISQNATELFDADRNRSLVAQFAPVTYTVSVSASPNNGGTANVSSPAHSSPYSFNENITVVANPNPGFTFTNWTENGSPVSTELSYSFNLTANRSLVANFSPSQYTITATSVDTQMGTVTGGGPYSYGASVSLTATAKTGYHFVNWTENGNPVSVDSTYSFTAQTNRDLVATFAMDQSDLITITARSSDEAKGTVSGSGPYQKNASVTVTATSKTGTYFVNWTENGQEVSTTPSYTFTADRDRTLVANFAATVTPNYTITYYPGSDVAAQPSYTDSSVGTTAYLRGQTYLKSGYTQTGWSYTQGGAKVYDLDKAVPISSNITLYPFWTKNVGTLKLTVNYSGEGVVYLNGAKVTSGAVYDLPEGLSYTFQMTPNSTDYYVYSINFAGKYWNANVDTDKFCVTYDMMKAENRTLTIRFDSVTASPKTGDDSHLLLWAVLGGVSLAAAATGVVLKKQSRI